MSTTGRYKNKTKILGIPCPGYGDRIWPEMELLRMQIIENMLLGGMRGALNSVFEEGAMRILVDENGKYRVTLLATGNAPSATGTVGGAYFKAPSSVAWEGLENGRTYLLYLKGSSKTFQDPSEVRPIASERRIMASNVVLLAKADLRGDNPVLDRNPDGKVNSRDLIQHVMDYENPHGDRQIQDELMIRRGLVFEDEAILEVGEDHDAIKIPVKQIALAIQDRVKTTKVDFKTGGQDGTILSADGNVIFVQVSRCCQGQVSSDTVGEIAIGYYGDDEAVKQPDQCIVRNTGAVGIPMRALIVTR